MAENTLALLEYLSSPESPLPSLTAGYTKPTTVYFQSFGHFFIYSFTTAKILYGFLFGLSVSYALTAFTPPAPALKQARGFVGDHLRGLFAVGSAVVGAVVGANVVAFFMAAVLKKPLSWFSVELSCVALYGPAALAGQFINVLHAVHVLTLAQVPWHRSSLFRACARRLSSVRSCFRRPVWLGSSRASGLDQLRYSSFPVSRCICRCSLTPSYHLAQTCRSGVMPLVK